MWYGTKIIPRESHSNASVRRESEMRGTLDGDFTRLCHWVAGVDHHLARCIVLSYLILDEMTSACKQAQKDRSADCLQQYIGTISVENKSLKAGRETRGCQNNAEDSLIPL